MKKLILFILLIPALVGCATHKHKRPIATQNGALLGYEETRWKYFAVDSKAARVSLEVSDLNYHRKVSAADAEVLADQETVKQLADGISQAVSNVVMEALAPK